MERILKNPHLWIILAIIACGGTLYYADHVPLLRNSSVLTTFNVARYSLHLVLSLIPVFYAAYMFGYYGGLAAAIFISLALLGRPLFISRSAEDIIGVFVFFVIGLMIVWLIERQRRTVHHLEETQRELTSSLGTCKNQGQQLASYYDIVTLIYKTPDVTEITNSALDKVLEITGADAGWIYLMDQDELMLATYTSTTPQSVRNARGIKPGENADGMAALRGSLVVERSKAGNTNEIALTPEDRIVAVVPMLSKGGLQGTLGILTSEQQFSHERSQMLAGLGVRVGLAVERAKVDQRERLTAEQLRLSEERYRGLFENASEAIFVCSGSGRIISVNRAGEDLTCYSYDELQALAMSQLFSGSGRETVEKAFTGDMSSIVVGRQEDLRLMRKDRTDAFVELKTNPVLKDNQTIGWQVIVRDVTEERQLHQNMQHYVAQITKAQEEERLRISRELHDETAQLLAGLSRGLDLVISDAGTLSESAVSSLKELRKTADSILEGVRRFSQDLRPSILDDLGLVPALEWLTSDLERHNVKSSFSVIGNQRRFAPDKELVVFRIAQEALNNVRKHAQVSKVDMAMDFDSDALTLTIQDNGVGFSLPDRISDLAKSGKLGLMGMRERARLVGGTFIIQSEPGSGTTITLRVPN